VDASGWGQFYRLGVNTARPGTAKEAVCEKLPLVVGFAVDYR